MIHGDKGHRITMLTGKHKKAKSEALGNKKEGSLRERRFENYLKKQPAGTQKGDREAMREHNLHEYDKPEYD